MTRYSLCWPSPIPADLRAQLLRNGQREGDHVPLVKFSCRGGAPLWLVSEMRMGGDSLFGLADLDFGCPKLGFLSLREFTFVQGTRGPLIRRDRWFSARYPLSVYAEAAPMAGGITEAGASLQLAAVAIGRDHSHRASRQR